VPWRGWASSGWIERSPEATGRGFGQTAARPGESRRTDCILSVAWRQSPYLGDVFQAIPGNMKTAISLLVCCLLVMCWSGYSLYYTITLNLTPTDERLFLCGKDYITKCADRFEYAALAFGTLITALIAIAFFTGAVFFWRGWRRHRAWDSPSSE